MKQTDKLIIVTGGAGFIGSNLVAALNNRGHDNILIVDHLNHPAKKQNLKRLRFTDYADRSEFRHRLNKSPVAQIECVFHLGANSSTTETDEAFLRDNNFLYSKQLCEWSLSNNIRFIYASSAATYGDGSNGYSDKHSNITALQPLNPYGRSKQMFDLWALESGAIHQIAGIKYFNVYGPGEDHKGEMRSLINKAYLQILTQQEVRLFKSYKPNCGDGEQKRDFIHVDDAVSITLFFLDHIEISGIFNGGTGIARTWKDLIRALFSAMNLPPKIRFVEMPGNIREHYQYYTKAEMKKLHQAGYQKPFLDIEEGVSRYVQNYLIPSNTDSFSHSEKSHT